MRELVSGFFFLGFSLFVLWGSLRLGLGSLHKPDSGFLSFYVGVILALLSLLHLYKGWKRRKTERPQEPYSRCVIAALLALFVYNSIMGPLGFMLASFLLLVVFFYLGESRPWWALIGMSALVTFAVYVIFGILLQVFFPKGLLGI